MSGRHALLTSGITLSGAGCPPNPTHEDALPARSRSARRFTALTFGLFASAALVLAVVGVYGLVAYGVTQRTREIGVRLALGATPSRIVGGVVRHGGRAGGLRGRDRALGGVRALAVHAGQHPAGEARGAAGPGARVARRVALCGASGLMALSS